MGQALSNFYTDIHKTFGPNTGHPFNDAEKLGGANQIEYMKEIRFHDGIIFETIGAVYSMNEGPDRTLKHGSKDHNKSIYLRPSEMLVGVSGRVGGIEKYKPKEYMHSVYFTIADTKTGIVRVEGPFGESGKNIEYGGAPFAAFGPIIAFKGMTDEDTTGDTLSILSLGFITKGEVTTTAGVTPLQTQK